MESFKIDNANNILSGNTGCHSIMVYDANKFENVCFDNVDEIINVNYLGVN